MIGAIILIIVLFGITIPILDSMRRGKPWFDTNLMKGLYWYHIFFAGVYYVMVMNSRSDSVGYFLRSKYEHYDWLSIYTTGTRFIDFLAYPFVKHLGFSYEMMMVLFTYLGYWGFVYFYMFFKENITYPHRFLANTSLGGRKKGIDMITLFIFLPNMHYWTSSLGKGSIIFWGLAMTMYGLSKINKRKLALILGLVIVYHVRPHVFLFMTVGIIVGMFTGRQKIPGYQKAIVFFGVGITLVLMYSTIMNFVGLDTENLVESFDKFSTTRSGELAKSNSGVDISNYPLILKLFTFWFRPLFFDAPGIAGLIVSFENVIYILLAANLFQPGFFKFIRVSSALVKTCAVAFLATSFALSATLSNMGIIIRQKSMVMYFFLFIIIAFLDYNQSVKMARRKKYMNDQKAEEEAEAEKQYQAGINGL
ncbi:MAG: hypothetical protein EOO04_25870 [Chitinophagaceae bacterium]|nr:MAG: hypothetical protein EOO04_25870 [Chitinophagaceae bacterium]